MRKSTDIIQVALILSAIDTALQAFAPFRRIGGGLPIVMGVSFAFLPALQAMGASGFSFGALLGGEIVGGAVAVLFGLAYSKIKWLFPPVVTGTVIFSIGVSLYPTAVKYMAGGMGTPLWGTPQAWCVALITFAVVFALANFGKGTFKLGSVFFGMIVGFGSKAGMFPLHGCLSSAHPVAPAPASAVLSAMIVKSGILAIIRVVYFIFGDDFIRGTWVQTTWLILTLLTVFMGSMLAYREPVLKKRLAYSTVSQLSYILFGMAMLTPNALTGSFLHVLAHGFVKATLFLVAGAIIYQTGKTRVSELTGIGKQMPVTMVCYTIVSLGLIGIPPTGGFISKWWLATGALFGRIPVFSVLGPVILLISALLTAGYLLPLTIQGFLPGAEQADVKWEKKEPTLWMLMPIVIMTALSVLMGLFPHVITDFMQTTLQAVF